eukprot:EG_transcript_3793
MQEKLPNTDAQPPGGAAGLCIAAADLRERLLHQLAAGTYECAVCCDVISRGQEIWSCDSCYHVIHLPCLQQWGMARLQPHGGFACPAGCRQPYKDGVFQLQYRCWCRKVKSPENNPFGPPHSCGATCGKQRSGTLCPHPCPLQCHPGPCPPCPATACRSCHCGKAERTEECAAPATGWSCEAECSRPLPCGLHCCAAPCHDGDCAPCDVTREVACWCGRHTKIIPCGEEESAGWCCGEVCGELLDCEQHHCPEPCHPASHPHTCYRSPKAVKTCCCGKTPLWKLHMLQPQLGLRKDCADPIPTCGQPCDKVLACGIENHTCGKPCHDGPCDDCLVLQTVTCRCGGKSAKVPCVLLYKAREEIDPELLRLDLEAVTALQPRPAQAPQAATVLEGRKVIGKSGRDEKVKFLQVKPAKKGPSVNVWLDLPLTCQKRCKETLICRRHKCEQVCCPFALAETEAERLLIHQCPQKCNRKLACRNHKCEEQCHDGPCAPCMEISLEEIRCKCGLTVIEPPIMCGDDRVPRCSMPCSIPRPCGHPANHECHLDGKCPPCLVMMQKMCLGGHVDMPFQTPCHHPAVSCAAPCGKPLPCGAHLCTRQCHDGPCSATASAESCGEPCWKVMTCTHVCNEPCHGASPCPVEKCAVKANCACLCGTMHSVKCKQYQRALALADQEYTATQQQWAATIKELRQLQLPIPAPPSLLAKPLRLRVLIPQPCCTVIPADSVAPPPADL